MAKKKAAKNKGYKLAAQLYSLRDLMQTPKEAAATLKKVRKMGYRNVQISGPIGNFDALEAREMCDAAGLSIVGAHIGLNQMQEDLDAIIDRLHTWGCSYVAIPFALGDVKNVSDVKAFARACDKVGKALRTEKIHLQYHNHAHEFTQFGRKGITGGRTALEILYTSTKPKSLQAEIDTCWVARGGGDPAAWIRWLKGRTDQVHLKDMVIHDKQPVFCAVGEGNLNWPAILKACKAARVKDYLVEQDNFPLSNDPLKSMAVSYKNLREMGLK